MVLHGSNGLFANTDKGDVGLGCAVVRTVVNTLFPIKPAPCKEFWRIDATFYDGERNCF